MLSDQGVGGATVASYRALVDARLAALAADAPVNTALVNLGTNDIANGPAGLPAQATWEGNLGYVLDAIQTKFPGITVYVHRPWHNLENGAAATVHTWIDNVISTRAWSAVGPDEVVWMKAGDNGATMSSDGVHYSTAGQAECAAQWLTVLGY